MAKYFLCGTILFFAPVLSYLNRSCLNKDKAGICTQIPDCHPLFEEIKEAGSPMPSRLSSKLKGLTRLCGFVGNEPLVCCVPTDTVPSTPTTVLPETSTVLPDSATGSSGVVVSSKIGQEVDIQKHPNFYLLPTNCGLVAGNRIWNGEQTDLFEMPWMVLLVYETVRGIDLICGGTLINERYVLTAAHCVTNLPNGTRLIGAILGEYNIHTNPDCVTGTYGVRTCAQPALNLTYETAKTHPEYETVFHTNDIALLRLSKTLDFETVTAGPICLPYTPELQLESLEGKNATVAGWGVTETGYSSHILRRVNLTIIPNSACGTAFNRSISDKQICVNGANKDSCSGDSGGPLMLKGAVGQYGERQVQRGIVSYGSRWCGLDSNPSVNTRVAHYLTWILDNITE